MAAFTFMMRNIFVESAQGYNITVLIYYINYKIECIIYTINNLIIFLDGLETIIVRQKGQFCNIDPLSPSLCEINAQLESCLLLQMTK